MLDTSAFETLAKNLVAALPGNLRPLEKDIQLKFKNVLQATFEHFDLVTREAFDVQTKVLARTREKVDALQTQLDAFIKKT